MQACLEVIADAVLQVVLYQVEADENESYLLNPDPSPLVTGVSLLIDLAKQKAKQWSETEEPQNEEIMLGYCQELYDSTMKIAEFLTKLTADAYDQSTKEELLFSCKNTMVATINLLQIADYYDIRKVEKSSMMVRKDISKLLKTSMGTLNEDIRVFIFSTVTLAKEVLYRAEYIVDTVLSAQLIHINQILTQDPETFIKLSAYLMQEPSDGLARDQRDSLEFKLLETIDMAVEVTRESSRRMFEGLLLDLTPIDRNKFISRNLGGAASIESLVTQMDQALEQLALDSMKAKSDAEYTANMLNDMKKMNSYFISLKNNVGKQIEIEESPHRKGAILSSLRVLEDSLKSVVISLKPTLKEPNDDNTMKLLQSIDACRAACEALQAATKGDDEYDLLNASAMNVRKALENLRTAIATGDTSSIILNTKDAVINLKNEVENIQDISPSLKTLIESSKLFATGHKDDSLVNQLNFLIDEVEEVAYYHRPHPVFQVIDNLRKLDLLMMSLFENQVSPEFVEMQMEKVLPLITQSKRLSEKGYSEAVEDLAVRTKNLFASLYHNHDVAERAIAFEEAYPGWKESLYKVAELSVVQTEDLSEAIIKNTTDLEYQTHKIRDSLIISDPETIAELKRITRDRLERQVMLAEMIERDREISARGGSDDSGSESEGEKQNTSVNDPNIMALSKQYKKLARLLEKSTSEKNNVETRKVCDEILNLNKEILEKNISPSFASNKIHDLNIDVETNIGEISKITDSNLQYSGSDIRPNLMHIADSLHQQELLAHVVKNDDNREKIERSLSSLSVAKKKVYNASADSLNTNDVSTKNRLKKILTETNIQSEILTSAVQKSLLDRILHNSEKIFQQIPLLLHSSSEIDDRDREIEKAKFVKRFEKQLLLCKKVSLNCNNQLLKVPFIKLLDHGKRSVDAYMMTKDAEGEDKIVMNLGTINQHLVRLSKESVNDNPEIEINNINDVAQQIEKFSNTLVEDEDIEIDDPKGRLSYVVKSVVTKMKLMHIGDAFKNKKEFIESSKSIAQIVSDIIAISKELLEQFPNAKNAIKNEMLEMAHAAKNFSVQLKILAAVKTSSAADDPSCESQLLTCAKGLSNSLIQIIHALQVLELTAN